MNHEVYREVDEILERLRRMATPQRQKRSEQSFPTAMEVYGVKVPDMRPMRKDLSGRWRQADPAWLVELALALVHTGVFEARQVAYELLDAHPEARETLDLETVEALGAGIDNWASVDTFAGYVAGGPWRDGHIKDTTVKKWARSEDRWWRRTAVVCTVCLNQKARGGTGDPGRTLMICEMAIDDHDDMVVKALSWALRELSKREPDAVRTFIDEHEGRLAKRVLREVRTKLKTGRKNG